MDLKKTYYSINSNSVLLYMDCFWNQSFIKYLSNILTFSQSKSYWWLILCSIITECCVVFQLCDFYIHLCVSNIYPGHIYDASQFRQSILYITSVWDSLERKSLWSLMNPLRLLIPLCSMCIKDFLKKFSDKSDVKKIVTSY